MKALIREIVRLKKRVLIAAALLALANLLLYAGCSLYLLPEVDALQQSWNEARQRLAVEGRTDVNALYRQGRADLAAIQERIPAKRQFPDLLGVILELADSNSLSSGNISYKPEKIKGQRLLGYSVAMNVSGSYAGIRSFIADIAEMRELVVIDRLAVTRAAQGDEVGLGLQLTVFVQEDV